MTSTINSLQIIH